MKSHKEVLVRDSDYKINHITLSRRETIARLILLTSNQCVMQGVFGWMLEGCLGEQMTEQRGRYGAVTRHCQATLVAAYRCHSAFFALRPTDRLQNSCKTFSPIEKCPFDDDSRTFIIVDN